MAQHLLNKIFDPQLVKQAWDLILKSEKITFLTHYKPDADGISACAALAHITQNMGKSIEAVYPTKAEFAPKRQPAKVLVNKHEQKPDLIIICDTANVDRLYFPEDFKNIPSINIDHHISNSIQATINLVSNKVSSASEAVYVLLQSWGPELIGTYVAECILMGMIYDTMIFQTQSTFSGTLRTAADLVEKGADLFKLQAELMHTKQPEVVKFWGTLLSNIQYSASKQSAWVAVCQADLKEHNLELPSLVGFSNFLSQLADIDITALFYETIDGNTKVSIRSKKADVNAIANQFGGGGHKNAAGIMIKEPLNIAVEKVTSKFK